MGTMQSSRVNLSSIDILRAIAIFSVVMYHYSWFVHPFETTFLRRGYIGVELFFMVSGFLASYCTKNLPSSYRLPFDYLLSRGIRIIPAYFIVTLGYLLTFYLMDLPRPSGKTILYSFMFIPNGELNGPSYGYPIVDVGWTLNYEFFFIH